jgi:hypothetical protein
MDSANRIPEMLEFARNRVDLTSAVAWINESWQSGVWTRLLKRTRKG